MRHLLSLMEIDAQMKIKAVVYKWDGDEYAYDGVNHLCFGGALHFDLPDSTSWKNGKARNIVTNVRPCDGSCDIQTIPITPVIEHEIRKQLLEIVEERSDR